LRENLEENLDTHYFPRENLPRENLGEPGHGRTWENLDTHYFPRENLGRTWTPTIFPGRTQGGEP